MEDNSTYLAMYFIYGLPSVAIISYFLAREKVANPSKYAAIGLLLGLFPIFAIIWFIYLYRKKPESLIEK